MGEPLRSADATPYLAPPYEQSVSARNEWLDSRLNPNGELPAVTVEHQYYMGHQPYSFDVFDPTGEPIGFISMNPPVWGEHFASVAGVQLHQSTKGKSYGTAAYLGAMKHLPIGVGLRSGKTLTKGSYQLWRSLEAAGVAVCDKTPEESHPQVGGETDGLYTDVHFETVFGHQPVPVVEPEPARATHRGRRLGHILKLARARN